MHKSFDGFLVQMAIMVINLVDRFKFLFSPPKQILVLAMSEKKIGNSLIWAQKKKKNEREIERGEVEYPLHMKLRTHINKGEC